MSDRPQTTELEQVVCGKCGQPFTRVRLWPGRVELRAPCPSCKPPPRAAGRFVAVDLPPGALAEMGETITQLFDEVDRLRAALRAIARMQVLPDDRANRMTLAAAITLAEGALGDE